MKTFFYLDKYHTNKNMKLEEHPAYGHISRLLLFKLGEHNHPMYGKINFTFSKLNKMKSQFDDRVRKIDIAVDYGHNAYEEAAGWVQELYFNEENNELWGIVSWTPAGKKAVEDRLYKYHSPEFGQYTDSETGKEYNDVLMGVALTNRPFLKDQPAIALSDEINEPQNGDNKMTQEELLAKQKELDDKETAMNEAQRKLDEQKKVQDAIQVENDKIKSDADAIVKETEAKEAAKLSEKEIEIKSIKENNKLLSEKIEKMEKASEVERKEKAFSKLLDEKKAVPAMKEAYMKGDMGAYAAAMPSEGLNFSEQGNSGNNDEPITAEEKKIANSLGLSEEDLKKYGNM